MSDWKTTGIGLVCAALLAGGAGCSGSGDGPDAGQDTGSRNCPAVVQYAFNPSTGECVQYSCNRPEGWEGDYNSKIDCEQDNNGSGSDAGMDGGADVGDTGSPPSDDTGDQADTGNSKDTGTTDTSNGGGDDTSGGDTGNGANDTSSADATPTCGDQGLTACFSNMDCQSSERCENTNASGSIQVPCCVEGARGSKTAGQECTSQTDCKSGICVSKNSGTSLCSKTCENAEDCPSGMKKCTRIFGSNGKWCLPN